MIARSGKPTATLYVDGFNLYRRVLAGYPHVKWLDLERLAVALLPEYQVERVRYFTAIIKTLPGADASSPQRQQAYLRALRTLPSVSIHLGKFRVDKRRMIQHPVTLDETGAPVQVTVKKTEEKGSDVALASWLMLDAMRGDDDIYVVLSNDSDLVTPLRLVREELGRSIGLVTPMEPKRASNELKQTNPTLHRHVTTSMLEDAQLPDRIDDVRGTITRPLKWTRNSEGPADSGAL